MLAERIEGAVAEKAVEVLFLDSLMAGEGLAFFVAEKCVMLAFPVGLSVVHNVASLFYILGSAALRSTIVHCNYTILAGDSKP